MEDQMKVMKKRRCYKIIIDMFYNKTYKPELVKPDL